MSWLLLAVQLVLSTVLLLAGTGKVLRSDEFSAALRLSHLPTVCVRVLQLAVPVLELGLALALVLATPRLLPFALAGTAALLAVFTIWMGWVRAHRLRVQCGCFGPGGPRVGGRSIARNLLLLVLALGGLGLAVRVDSPLPESPSLWLTVTATAAGMLVALLVALQAALPALALSLDRLPPATDGAHGRA
jgi:hypothetical protein